MNSDSIGNSDSVGNSDSIGNSESYKNGVNIVCEGGWTVFNKQFSIVQKEIIEKKIQINSIIGYSAGVLCGLLICLGYTELEYLEVLDSIPQLGNLITYTQEFIDKENSIYTMMNLLFLPFFNYKKISHYLTLGELKELSGIDLFIVTARSKTNIEDPLENFNFSAETHPDIQLLSALSLSISQSNSLLNFQPLDFLRYTYQDTPTQTAYIYSITSQLKGDTLYIGIEPDLALFPLSSEDPTLYFKWIIFYNRDILQTTLIRELIGLTLNGLFMLEPIQNAIKGIASSNDSLEDVQISLSNTQTELTDVFAFFVDPNYRENIYMSSKKNYKITRL